MTTFTMPSFTALLLCKCKAAHKIPNWSYSVALDSGYGFTAGVFAVGFGLTQCGCFYLFLVSGKEGNTNGYSSGMCINANSIYIV